VQAANRTLVPATPQGNAAEKTNQSNINKSKTNLTRQQQSCFTKGAVRFIKERSQKKRSSTTKALIDLKRANGYRSR